MIHLVTIDYAKHINIKKQIHFRFSLMETNSPNITYWHLYHDTNNKYQKSLTK
jgi:hypothetical protein